MNHSRSKLKIGVLGAGNVAKDLHLPVLANMPEVKIEWICDKSEERAHQLARLFRIGVVYNDIKNCNEVDIVLVAIPVGYRCEVMNSLFLRGWHAFCEKPFANTLGECDQYLFEASKNNTQVGVGMVRRYSAPSVIAKKMVHEEYFGPIVEIWGSDGRRSKRTGKEAGWYMADPKAVGGGVLMETGSHLVDQMCWILNIVEFDLYRCVQWQFHGLDFETRLSGIVSTEKQRDIKCTVEVSRLADLCNGIFIKFSNFILKCGLVFGDPLELLRLDGTLISRFETDGAKTIEQGFFLEWKDFIDQCISGTPSVISADTVRQSIAIIEQCYHRAEKMDLSNFNRIGRR